MGRGLIPDPVILRGDGSPLYNFATVIDDAQMQITHVVRAEEHLSNTPVQVLLHRALGNQVPLFAHVPYVAAPGTKEKLSKRKVEQYRKNPLFARLFQRADEVFPKLGLAGSAALDPVMVEYYERLGYLPEAIINALGRLGWSLDEKTEIISRQTMIEHFTLDRIVKAPAGFDVEKLQSYQAYWMGQLSMDEKIDGCWPFLVKAGLVADVTLTSDIRSRLSQVLAAVGDRLKVFSDILDFDEFFQPGDEPRYDEKAFKQRLIDAPEAAGLLASLKEELATVEPFDAPTLDKLVHDFVAAQGIKIGQIIHPLRVAVTGKSVGVGLFDALAIFGRERCLKRIDYAQSRIRS